MKEQSKELIAMAWIIVGLVVLPLIVLYPPVVMVAIVGYALRILYTHYKAQKREKADTVIFSPIYIISSTWYPPQQVSSIFRRNTNWFEIQSTFRIHKQYFQMKMCVVWIGRIVKASFSQYDLFLERVCSLLRRRRGRGAVFIFSPIYVRI